MTRRDFLLSAAHAQHDECIMWPYAIRQGNGYGAFSLPLGKRNHKRNVEAHIYACELAHGPRPSVDHQAAHSCGRKLCCNGNHLRWATRIENMADAKSHGTLRGGGRYRPRLSPDDVVAIRASGASLSVLSARYDLPIPYISRVRSGRCHAHV